MNRLRWVRLQANLKTQLLALRRLVAGSVSVEPEKHVVDLDHWSFSSSALYKNQNWQQGRMLTCLNQTVDLCVQRGDRRDAGSLMDPTYIYTRYLAD